MNIRQVFRNLPTHMRVAILEQLERELSKPDPLPNPLYQTCVFISNEDKKFEQTFARRTGHLDTSHILPGLEDLNMYSKTKSAAILQYQTSGVDSADIKDFSFAYLDECLKQNIVTPVQEKKIMEVLKRRNHRGLSAMHTAACFQHSKYLFLLKSQGGNVNDMNSDGWTPLHEAVDKGSMPCVTFLAQNDASINQKALISGRLLTPLLLACAKGRPEIVRYLLSQGADGWATDDLNDRQTAVHQCLWDRGIDYRTSVGDEIIEILLKWDTRLAMARDARFTTPLHHAAGSGRIHAIELLLENRADINAVDINGLTPLHTLWSTIHILRNQRLVNMLRYSSYPPFIGSLIDKHLQKHLLRCRDFLIENGANLNAQFDGMSPSKYAFKTWFILTEDDVSEEVYRRSRFRSFDGAITNSFRAWHVRLYSSNLHANAAE